MLELNLRASLVSAIRGRRDCRSVRKTRKNGDEMSRGIRTGRRRVMLQAEPTFVRQVNDLTNTLYQTDRNMARNEELLTDFIEVSREQDEEISQVLNMSGV